MSHDRPGAASSLTSPPSHGRTILLAEDEHLVRTLMRQVLECEGFVVLEATDGAAALEIVRDEARRIDLLVTDVVMPRLDGRQLADQLRSLRPELPTLFVTGGAGSNVVRGNGRSPAEALLLKPFRPDALVAAVRGLLDARG